MDRGGQRHRHHPGVLAGIEKAQKIGVGLGDQRHPGTALQIQPQQLAGDVNGLRLGVPEIVRLGLGPAEMEELAALIARGLRSESDAQAAASEVTALRRRFGSLRFVRG